MSASIALAAVDRKLRGELGRYLAAAGFEVQEFDQPPKPRGFWALVWLTERELHARVAETVVSAWIAHGDARRAVIVTWRPTALRELADAHPVRLVVLPPPVFGWQVVDALRADDRGPDAP